MSELRDRLGETLERVDREDTFVYVTRHGRRIGAIMHADIAENHERIRRRVLGTLDNLADNPRPVGCVELTGTDVWRIRTARGWRIPLRKPR